MNDNNEIIKNLLRTGAYLHRVGNRIISKYGLQQQQFVVLNEISVRGRINQKELTSRLLFEKSNISKIIKKLKSLNLIKTTTSKDDKRIILLEVTDSGKKTLNSCTVELNTWNKNWLKPLSKKDIKTAEYILEKITGLAISDKEKIND